MRAESSRLIPRVASAELVEWNDLVAVALIARVCSRSILFRAFMRTESERFERDAEPVGEFKRDETWQADVSSRVSAASRACDNAPWAELCRVHNSLAITQIKDCFATREKDYQLGTRSKPT